MSSNRSTAKRIRSTFNDAPFSGHCPHSPFAPHLNATAYPFFPFSRTTTNTPF